MDMPRSDVRPFRVSFEFFPPRTPEMEESLWHAIQRLDITAKAFRRPGIEQPSRRLLQPCSNLINAGNLSAIELRPVLSRRHGQVFGVDRITQRRPARESAIEHCHPLVAEQTQ